MLHDTYIQLQNAMQTSLELKLDTLILRLNHLYKILNGSLQDLSSKINDQNPQNNMNLFLQRSVTLVMILRELY